MMSGKVSAVIKPRTAMFMIRGSLAALVKESVWALLLKGEAVGVLEPDENYWSLFCDGRLLETCYVQARPTLSREKAAQHAVEKFAKKSFAFMMDFPKIGRGRTSHSWRIEQGYPNVICLSAENIERHKRDGMDDRKLALRMRELIKNHVVMEQIQDELKFGLKREGKDW